MDRLISIRELTLWFGLGRTGHSNTRVTFEMYIGSVAGALERARQATG
jgi:hypothetical protein